MQELFPTGWEARGKYYQWFQESVESGFLDMDFLLYWIGHGLH
jgi:hypothetical protein